jgi:hypothetical protein
MATIRNPSFLALSDIIDVDFVVTCFWTVSALDIEINGRCLCDQEME